MNQIKNIVFDFGGVIVTLDHQNAVREFARLGLKNADTILNPYTQGGIFGELELGHLSAEDFIGRLGELCGRKLAHEECLHAWLAYRKELPERNLQALRNLRKAGYRLILLSNTNPFMMQWASSPQFDGHGHAVEDYFDSVYVSYRVGVMKPDQAFFRHVLMEEQIAPSETLFVDDGPRNVAAASELGFNTYCPENGADWTREITNHLRRQAYDLHPESALTTR